MKRSAECAGIGALRREHKFRLCRITSNSEFRAKTPRNRDEKAGGDGTVEALERNFGLVFNRC
jgi:hypothetical protein